MNLYYYQLEDKKYLYSLTNEDDIPIVNLALTDDIESVIAQYT